jgi:formate hydrogenlyase subunit 4
LVGKYYFLISTSSEDINTTKLLEHIAKKLDLIQILNLLKMFNLMMMVFSKMMSF